MATETTNDQQQLIKSVCSLENHKTRCKICKPDLDGWVRGSIYNKQIIQYINIYICVYLKYTIYIHIQECTILTFKDMFNYTLKSPRGPPLLEEQNKPAFHPKAQKFAPSFLPSNDSTFQHWRYASPDTPGPTRDHENRPCPTGGGRLDLTT